MTPLVALLLLQAAADSAQWFEEKIRPLLAERCIGCHGDAKVSGLRLDSREGVLKGGHRGPAALPGDPERSRMIQAIRRAGNLKMPPNAPLPPEEAANLERWVQLGAPWPETKLVTRSGKITPEHKQWWAFQPLRSPSPPVIAGARTPVDRFIRARQIEAKVKPVPLADRRTLIRRLSFDLIGLPPTPEQVDAFVRSGDTAAEVDRLLASKQFGERWGRYWLDVARYGEDDVLGLSQEKYPNAWRYRDWVVDALNRDLPYDVFLKAQLAADRMEGDFSMDLRPALGFLGLGPWQYSVSPPPQARADERHDRIDAIGRGFLGLTVACSRCHDHKFDPITMRDYYGMAGVFFNTEYREYPLAEKSEVERFDKHGQAIRATERELREFLGQQRTQLGEILASQTAAYLKAVRDGGGDLDAAVLDRWKKYLAKPEKDHPLTEGWNSPDGPERIGQLVASIIAEKKELDEERRLAVERTRPMKGASKTRLPNGFETYDEFCPGCDVAVRALERDRYMFWQDLFRESSKDKPGGVLYFDDKSLEPFLSPEWRRHAELLRSRIAELKKSAPPQYPFLHGVADKERIGNLRIAQRGDPYRLGEEAPRRFLEVLTEGEPVIWSEGSGRLALAEAIVKQPVAARVAANRIWLNIFGRGLVNSPSNFGKLGERPSHPELLDYLATRLTAQRWSVKKLIREIVLSDTYALSSSAQAANEAEDAANKFYWRAPRKRLDAEALRDSLLYVSGKLDPAIGGPSAELGPDHERRTVYGRVSRFQLNQTLALFDFPSPSATSEKRVTTHVPLQRLYFLNGDSVAKQSAAFASRIQQSATDVAGRIRWAYRILYGRHPSPEESRLGQEFLRDGEWKQYAQVLLSSNEFQFVD